MNKHNRPLSYLVLLILIIPYSAKADVTRLDGEYLTSETHFEYEVTTAQDNNGDLLGYFGITSVGDILTFDFQESLFGEMYQTVYDIDLTSFLINLDIKINDQYIANNTIEDLWKILFWSFFLLPIEYSNDNLFDALQVQDPARWDKDGPLVTYDDNPHDEFIYYYDMGYAQSASFTYSDYVLGIAHVPNPVDSSTITDTNGSCPADNKSNIFDKVPFNMSAMLIAIGFLAIVGVKKPHN